MRETVRIEDLSAVVISHMHADHFFDLVPLRYALRYETQRPQPLPVYVPPGATRVLTEIAHPLKETDDFFDGVFDLHEYVPQEELAIGGCSVRFAPTVHYVPAYAMRVETPDGVVGFSADTAPCDAVPVLVRGADLFLCEAALGADGSENGERGHLNAREAGQMAQRAGAQHLILTHYGTPASPVALRDAAAETFSGPITVADDGVEIPLGH
jgi:ribonuclease BN (tRNA processing enzyme)